MPQARELSAAMERLPERSAHLSQHTDAAFRIMVPTIVSLLQLS
jgi:hypothetical protein